MLNEIIKVLTVVEDKVPEETLDNDQDNQIEMIEVVKPSKKKKNNSKLIDESIGFYDSRSTRWRHNRSREKDKEGSKVKIKTDIDSQGLRELNWKLLSSRFWDRGSKLQWSGELSR